MLTTEEPSSAEMFQNKQNAGNLKVDDSFSLEKPS